jgi:hypothetical protein
MKALGSDRAGPGDQIAARRSRLPASVISPRPRAFLADGRVIDSEVFSLEVR